MKMTTQIRVAMIALVTACANITSAQGYVKDQKPFDLFEPQPFVPLPYNGRPQGLELTRRIERVVPEWTPSHIERAILVRLPAAIAGETAVQYFARFKMPQMPISNSIEVDAGGPLATAHPYELPKPGDPLYDAKNENLLGTYQAGNAVRVYLRGVFHNYEFFPRLSYPPKKEGVKTEKGTET
jgi:hypothetical protein